jgi:predicted DNA-binding transcriptional regulator AlpA
MLQQQIPATGFLRQRQLIGDPKGKPPVSPILPVGGTTLWRWVAAGTFPKPVKLSGGVTAWRCEDVHAWMEQRSAATGRDAA